MSIGKFTKKKYISSLIYIVCAIFIIFSTDLNILQTHLKASLLILLLLGILISFYEKKKIINDITSKYENTSIILENVYKYFPDYIICKDENMRINIYNHALKKILKKYKVNHLKGHKITDVIAQECADTVHMYDSKVLKQGTVERFQLYSDSLKKHFECISVPLKNAHSITGLMTLIKDITEEVKLKEELKESYFQVEAVVKNIPMIAYITDLNGNYIIGNPQSYKFYMEGIDPEYTNIQIDMTLINEIHSIENLQIKNTRETIITEKHLKAIDGSFHWYSWRKVPLINTYGEIKGVIIFIKNIDIIKNVQKQRDNYIATLSHDLKTPTLAQIRTLELFLKGSVGPLNKEQLELVKLMLDSSHYMYSMVETLVYTYKYENGEVILTYEDFNLLHLIEETIKELDELIKHSKVNIKIESKVEEPIINADKSQLKRVIENLISNGVSYGYKNTTLTILINEVRENNIPKICVKFINNSPYMNPETINNIFKKYVSHADKFNRVGAGLGLYLFKQIIDAHKGNVIVTSSKDDINTFGFVINK